MENVTNTMTDFGRCIESDLDFWSHLYKTHQMENISFNCIGIINNFNKYMYKVHNIYFVSNYLNLDDKYNQFKENEINSFTGYVLSFKNEAFNLSLCKFSLFLINKMSYWIIWKINIKELLSKICFIKFKIKESNLVGDKILEWEHVLEYEDLSKLEGLGWIEYKLPYNTYYKRWVQPSIEVNDGHIDMQIDYVRFIQYNEEQTKISHILSNHEIYLNVPEVFKENYFSRKEMENLLELKDIISNL
ncbi:hypothetical protein RhiirA5_416439 [Rhizophagus irregularis]|uniref:Uncharacterized protein n=1 Tax=Rhizophagus irregularis TaxID=588596 RepID=A0A2N0PPV1_9GLOM|nr:hypothetical protein RhiirA5_416439 [Rhizophagus irregularis]PKC66800.1 hypothetical protein RhiirA1_459251 [Rhizophagus irregularis]CAB5103641.1 unnamed protein product [Rhizophagus irregularis]